MPRIPSANDFRTPRLPTADDFPKWVDVTITPPPNDDPPTNLLFLLHGLGDTNASFTHLATQLNLPETCCLALQGIKPLLDLGGYHYADDVIFDNTCSNIDPDGGFFDISVILQMLIHAILVLECHFRADNIFLLGFGQGGMAALTTAALIDARHIAKDPALVELGGIVSIGAGLSRQAPAELDPKCRTPVLVCAGSEESSSVMREAEEQFLGVFRHVQVHRYARPGDTMPANRDEMWPIMHFFSTRLRSVKGVPEGAVEIT